MSTDTDTGAEAPARETKRQREAREAAEEAARQEALQIDLSALTDLDEDAEDLTDEQRAAFASLTDKQREQLAELREVASIQGFTGATDLPEEFRKQTTPVRNRNPKQLAMDEVARQAYSAWVEAGRPTTWSRMPTVTYFLDPEEVAERRSLIRKAVAIVVPEPYEKDGKRIEPSGVRARYGNEFPLTEKAAEKIGKPEEVGKTVLAFAAVDKRHVSDTGNGDD